MKFMFEKLMKEEMLKEFDIDLSDTNIESIFAVDSIESDIPDKPFDRIYKGTISIHKKDNDQFRYFNFTIDSHENIPDQSICTFKETAIYEE